MSDPLHPSLPPTPEGHAPGAEHHAVTYEHKDITARPVVIFLVLVVVVTALTFVGVMGMMVVLNRHFAVVEESPYGPNPAVVETEKTGLPPMSVGPMPGDEKRDRFRAGPEKELSKEQANRSGIGYTPRIEGIDLHNPENPYHIPEHTVGRIYPSTAAEQAARETAYLGSWSAYTPDKTPTHVPIDVAMRLLAVKPPEGVPALPLDEWQTAPSRSSSGRVSRDPGPNAAALGHDAEVPKK